MTVAIPDDHKPRRTPILVEDVDDIRRLVRDLRRDGFELTKQDIVDILESRATRGARQEQMQRQLAEAMKDIPALAAVEFLPRRGGGKRGQRGAARARRGSW